MPQTNAINHQKYHCYVFSTNLIFVFIFFTSLQVSVLSNHRFEALTYDSTNDYNDFPDLSQYDSTEDQHSEHQQQTGK